MTEAKLPKATFYIGKDNLQGKDLLLRLKVLSAKAGYTQSQLVTEAIEDLIKKYETELGITL